MLKTYRIDCGCRAQAALPTIKSRLHGYMVAHVGRDRRKRREEETCMDKRVQRDVQEC